MRSRSSGRDSVCMVCVAVTCVVVAVWHLSLLFGRSYSSDFDIICEVSRRVAAGGKLYADAVDPRGPLMYAPMVFRWLTSPSWGAVFVRSVVLESLLSAVTVCLVARVVHEAHGDGEHVGSVVAIGCLAVVFLTGFVGAAESETRVVPGCLVAVLLVLRERRGVPVRWWQWLLVGCFAGYTLWTKFPLCGVFVVILVYGIVVCGPARMARPFLLAMCGVAIVTIVALAIVMAFSDLPLVLSGYLFASGGGYLWRMLSGSFSELTYGAVPLVVFKFVRWALGLCVGVFTFVCLVRRAGSLHGALVWCCVALPVYGILLIPCPSYYREPLIAFVALAFGMGDWSLRRLSDGFHVGVMTAFVFLMVVAVIVGGLRCVAHVESLDDSRFSELVRRETGGDDSVCAGYFGALWCMVDLGMETPYPTPAPNNSVGAFDQLESDVRYGRWRWVIWNFKQWYEEVPAEGETVSFFGRDAVCAVVDRHGNALLRLSDVDEGNLMHSRPIAWPDPWVPVA